MKNVVDHPRPCLPPPAGASSLTVDLAPFGMPGRYERLVVVPSPEGDCVIACLPFFSYGIQFGDRVEVRDPGPVFVRVAQASGLRTLRIAFHREEQARDRHEWLHGELRKAALPHEWHGAGYLAVLLRGRADQVRALAYVADAVREGAVSWEVDPAPFSAASINSEGGAEPVASADRPRDTR
jgi:uncharacterized protein DUF4265